MPDTSSPVPVPQPLAGLTTADEKMTFEPERLSYQSACELAVAVAAAIPTNDKRKRIVLASLADLADLANLRGTLVMLDLLEQDYSQIRGSAQTAAGRRTAKSFAVGGVLPPVTALSGIASVISAGLGIASLFRQDVSYVGSPTSVDAIAFEIAIAAELNKLGFEHVLIPALGLFTASPPGDSLKDKLRKLEAAKLSVWQTVQPMVSELVALDTQLDLASRAKNQPEIDRLTTEVNALRADLAPLTEPLAALDQRWSQIQGDWQKTSPDTGLTGFARLLRAESVQRGDPVYLHAAVVSSGGYRRISRSLFRTIFTGDGLSFTGGTIIRWALLSASGEFQAGGLLTTEKTKDTDPWYT